MHWRFATIALIGLATVVPDARHPLSLGPNRAQAMTAVELTLEDLVQGASLVMVGTPVESRSLWEESDGARANRIVTYTRLQVDDVLDGSAPTEPVWVRTLGGHVGDVGQRVEGEVVFDPTEPCLLFLRRRNDKTHSIIGMSQGHYPVVDTSNGAAKPGGRRLLPPRHVDALVARPGQDLGASTAARIHLAGRTLDEVRALVAAERKRHAP